MIPVWLLTTKAKLIGVGLLVAFALWYHFTAIARAKEEQAVETRAKVTLELSEQYAADYAAKSQALGAQIAEEQQRNAALSSRLRDLNQTLNRGLGELAGRETELRNETLAIADADVVARYRAALAGARVADAARANR